MKINYTYLHMAKWFMARRMFRSFFFQNHGFASRSFCYMSGEYQLRIIYSFHFLLTKNPCWTKKAITWTIMYMLQFHIISACHTFFPTVHAVCFKEISTKLIPKVSTCFVFFHHQRFSVVKAMWWFCHGAEGGANSSTMNHLVKI